MFCTDLKHSNKQIYSAQTEIKKLWEIKAASAESILELRAIIPSAPPIVKIFKGRNYSSVETLKLVFEQEALRLNADGYNIYYVMNPIKDDFQSGSAKDADIKYRDLLLIDIDRVGNKKDSATDAQVEAAGLLADEITTFFKEQGWKDEPIRLMSGNGHHLYYTLDNLPNDEKHKSLIEAALKELATKFNNEEVAVDTVVFNASRITKVPGTIARKGLNTEERPYRMARVL